MDLLLGLDVGTTATKASLFDLAGNIVASASYNYGLITPQEGWVEQDPEELWRGVVETSRSVMEQVPAGGRIVALSQSSQGGTTIPVDVDGHAIRNAFSWMDQRADENAEYVKGKWGADFIHMTTGWPLYCGLPLQHIGWLRDNRPGEYAAARHFLFVNDFIGLRMTGRLCMNPSDASITQLMNIATADWDKRLMDIVGITRDRLSPIRPSGQVVGTLTAKFSQATGLPQTVPVVNGAHDQYCAAVGIGVTQPGHVMLSCGTAWVLLAVPASLEAGLRSALSVSCHAVQGRWGAQVDLGAVGTSVEWFLDNVWTEKGTDVPRESLYSAISEGIARSSPGAQGLLFFPLSGGHAAAIGPTTGGFVGLTLSHARDDMARAVLEGVAFELRWAIEEAQKARVDITELKMVGGAAESSVWPQIVADITGVPVILPAAKQAASRGAAILAGVGVGIFSDPEAGFAAFGVQETRVEPVSANRSRYDDLFTKYQRLYQAFGS